MSVGSEQTKYQTIMEAFDDGEDALIEKRAVAEGRLDNQLLDVDEIREQEERYREARRYMLEMRQAIALALAAFAGDDKDFDVEYAYTLIGPYIADGRQPTREQAIEALRDAFEGKI